METHLLLIGAGSIGVLFAIAILLAMAFRVVVSTNDVHIVQSAKRTVSYGKDQPAGNTYYRWPAWVPIIGVRTINLPVSVFDVDLTNYAAYDKGRVPFAIDIMAFFRIEDSNVAAQRVHSFDELLGQLKGILQGACRSILASSEIEEILEGRSKFGQMFTDAVDVQLKAWGVVDVKNIELMDIRDAEGSSVIANIMAKKKSLIERESRTAVAENLRAAQEAEIAAKRQVGLASQEAEEQVGIRTALKEQNVGIADQKAHQRVKEEEKTTAEKEMAVTQVMQVRQAEITRDVTVVQADQERQTMVIKAEGAKQQQIVQSQGIQQAAIIEAEGQKQQTVLIATGDLEQAKLHAQGVEAEGRARGAADQAVLMAPVTAQITLAKEIGTNAGYQTYLLGIKGIDKDQAVGIAQAEALKAADIKVIANSGDVSSGVKDVMGLLTSKGGTQLGAMAEAFMQTPAGAAMLKKFSGNGSAAEH